MIRTFKNEFFLWIDVLNPGPDELQTLASEHGIHEAFIADVLQPEHLPKFESVDSTSFLILRYYSAKDEEELDTIQGLTNKIAVFHKKELIITIHKYEVDFIDSLKRDYVDSGACPDSFHLLNRIVKAVFQSFDAPALALARDIDLYESKTFLKKNPPLILIGLYHVKRKIEVSLRLLILSIDVLDKIDTGRNHDPDTRDTRDLFIRIHTLFQSMSDNTNQLLTIYFSIASQRTNEVIRVLTIFSVFFMPLTFIVGIYGMNFKFMPELDWRVGYPLIWLVMFLVTASIFLWFRRKGWL